MTWREVLLCPVVSWHAMLRGKTEEDRLAWEIARWRSFNDIQLSPYIKAGQRPRTLKQFHRFPWEDENIEKHEPIILTHEQESELFRIMNNINKH